ncbi:MAG: hypothetical protein ACHQRM_00750 [Bacteroidia bacterium]
MNTKVILALILHTLIVALCFFQNTVVGMVMLVFLIFNLLGIILLSTGQQKTGNICFLVGCIGFIPIGFIGALGARANLDKLSEQEFELKRQKQKT